MNVFFSCVKHNKMISYKFHKSCTTLIRQFSVVKSSVQLDDKVSKEIDNSNIKPRNHPGRLTCKTVKVPNSVVKAIENIMEDYPLKTLKEESILLARYLHARHPPVELSELTKVKRQVTQDVLDKFDKQYKTDESYVQGLNAEIQKKLLQKVYNWIPIQYEERKSLLYLLARFAPEYATLVKILSEISSKDAKFKPRSLFDFGSGTGTVTWATKSIWENNLYEYFNVDSSAQMHDLAQLLLQGGRGTAQINLKGVFYRQFLPANNVAYDLVVSAYSLLELPSRRTRLQTILNLWNKTASYLVIVEQGTNAGFHVVNEARDFILNIQQEDNKGYVLSPCSHDVVCPRFVRDTIPCNFEVAYFPLPIGAPTNIVNERYSYVVLKKGIRSDDPQWPRLIETPLVRSRHVICRLCTKQGKLEEIIFTKSKHGKAMYHCARSSKWGDLLPLTYKYNDVINDNN